MPYKDGTNNERDRAHGIAHMHRQRAKRSTELFPCQNCGRMHANKTILGNPTPACSTTCGNALRTAINGGLNNDKKILALIGKRRNITPAELARWLGLSGNTITRHLKALRESGKVASDRGMYQLKEQSCN